MTEQPRRQLRHSLDTEAKQKSLIKGIALFILAAAIYVGSFLASMSAPLWLVLPLLVVNGVAIACLLVIGHDCGHRSYLASPRIEKLLGHLAFLPSLWNYTGWRVSHNQLHHGYTNLRQKDISWVPLTFEDYSALGIPSQLYYRHCRSWFGFATHWIVEIWIRHSIWPPKAELASTQQRATEFFVDQLIVLFFLLAEVGLVVFWTRDHAIRQLLAEPVGSLSCIAIFIGIPFWIQAFVSGLVTFLHHTHPTTVWFHRQEDWSASRASVHGTVHFEFPFPVNRMFLNIMEHNAHHVDTGIPLYNLVKQQQNLERDYPDGIFLEHYSMRTINRILTCCQLYDYENRQWVGYDGKMKERSKLQQKHNSDHRPSVDLAGK